MMLDEITTQINKRSSNHDCKQNIQDQALENFKSEKLKSQFSF